MADIHPVSPLFGQPLEAVKTDKPCLLVCKPLHHAAHAPALVHTEFQVGAEVLPHLLRAKIVEFLLLKGREDDRSSAGYIDSSVGTVHQLMSQLVRLCGSGLTMIGTAQALELHH